MDKNIENTKQRLPKWLKRGIVDIEKTRKVRKLLKDLKINTVCNDARCPNKAECYSNNVATFMILGNTCTRNCAFCSVNHDTPTNVDKNEPERIAQAVKELNLNYIVITSVTRDDLNDGGASLFASTVKSIQNINSNVKIEVLVPDFKGNLDAVKLVIDSGINVFNHNIETVKELYAQVRPQANYVRSLEILDFAKKYNPNIITKSGFMVGFGESYPQIEALFKDLKEYNCDLVTIGQYIQPTKQNIQVSRYYTGEEFIYLKELGSKYGLKNIVSGGLVRSSYNAFESFSQMNNYNVK